MLRIAKSTPGVLDLSPVKDEHGIPVTLIGPSHRDVPDHEGNNPVLERVVELKWVTVSKVPVETSDGTVLEASSGLEQEPDPLPVLDEAPLDPAPATEPGPPALAEPASASSNLDSQSSDQTSMMSVPDAVPSPTAKSERKSSRRA